MGERYAVSPDGKQLAVFDQQNQLWLQPSAGGEGRKVPGAQPRDMIAGWSADGSTLYLAQIKPPAIAKLSLATGKREPFRDLAQPDRAGAGNVTFARMTSDGRSYAWNYDIRETELYLVEGVK